ncbi:hypothetical protein Csa_020939 [Cucumis sativus]|uniref:Uncharacterized protein n=1 Tax=Cucumis sativus TaxID=3659 RepID=A0A0A0KEQ5_CUCSA|nr:hypothetical protein Csa_020939 [Cucumis sativus]
MELETESKNTIPVLINVVEVLLRVLNLTHLSLSGIRLAEYNEADSMVLIAKMKQRTNSELKPQRGLQNPMKGHIIYINTLNLK